MTLASGARRGRRKSWCLAENAALRISVDSRTSPIVATRLPKEAIQSRRKCLQSRPGHWPVVLKFSRSAASECRAGGSKPFVGNRTNIEGRFKWDRLLVAYWIYCTSKKADLGRAAVPIDDRDYVAAWRSGGPVAVESLLALRCPDQGTRIRELELLEVLGVWDIRWHRSPETGKLDHGVIKAMCRPLVTPVRARCCADGG
jgi:hypothetical protein